MIVAIDGPAGSGKGTIASILSKKLNLVNIDTGATYRCVALKVLRNKLNIDDKEEIIKLSNNIDIRFDINNNVYLDGIDVTKEIRSKEVTNIVSPISSIVEVRKNMVDLQRRLGNSNNVVMEGRDITTVVFPNADFKFYLDATLEERVKRRYKEYKEKNIEMSYEEVYENIKNRDYNDSHKEVGSLMRTKDQIYIDSTNLTIEEVTNKFMEVLK
ncbi:MAG TPA: (d)CMP kinase [Candidatus Faecisoma merdavium]|nr:(d)CMP kinase [Candidatus Faecisoma merdavium]